MTDRVMALTVLLEKDTREDDLDSLITAIRMLRNVSRVDKHIVSGEQALANYRARTDAAMRLMELGGKMLRGDEGGSDASD